MMPSCVDLRPYINIHFEASIEGTFHSLASIQLHQRYTRIPKDPTKAALLRKLAYDQGFQPARDGLGQLTAMYPAGTRVRITGLTAAANLNGRLGTAVQPTKPLAAGRIAVRIDGQTKSVSLSWANVQHV